MTTTSQQSPKRLNTLCRNLRLITVRHRILGGISLICHLKTRRLFHIVSIHREMSWMQKKSIIFYGILRKRSPISHTSNTLLLSETQVFKIGRGRIVASAMFKIPLPLSGLVAIPFNPSLSQKQKAGFSKWRPGRAGKINYLPNHDIDKQKVGLTTVFLTYPDDTNRYQATYSFSLTATKRR